MTRGPLLAETHPELAAQADGWDPSTLTAGSGKKVGWKCERGHHYVSTPTNRKRGRGCPFCSNNQILRGFNDLATTNPNLALEADGWDPELTTSGSRKNLSWICKLNHKWFASPNNRTSHKSGCPYCGGKRAWPGFNDLATSHPLIAAQADGWDPSTLTAGSKKKVGWICELGHHYVNAPQELLRGRGCSVCSGRQIHRGINDLATTHPLIAAQADGWDPSTLTAGSGKKVGWKCERGHSFRTTPNGRTSNKSNKGGCPYCSGNLVLPGFNDLVTIDPVLANEADGWDPSTLTAGSSKKVGWKCERGHSWRALVKDRSTGAGCPSCAKFGFDPNSDGWLYFIDHDELNMFQIGISNFPVSRLGKHAKRSWEVLEVRGPMEGRLAKQLESAILHAVQCRGAILGDKLGIEKFDGYSEAWTKQSLNVNSLSQMIGWVYEDEGVNDDK